MFLCKPIARGTSQAVRYDKGSISELFELVERHIGTISEARIDSAANLNVTIRAVEEGTLVSQEMTYDIPIGSIIVFNKPLLEILSSQDFDKKYERVGNQPNTDPNGGGNKPNNP